MSSVVSLEKTLSSLFQADTQALYERLQLSSKICRTWLESTCFMALIPLRTDYL